MARLGMDLHLVSKKAMRSGADGEVRYSPNSELLRWVARVLQFHATIVAGLLGGLLMVLRCWMCIASERVCH